MKWKVWVRFPALQDYFPTPQCEYRTLGPTQWVTAALFPELKRREHKNWPLISIQCRGDLHSYSPMSWWHSAEIIKQRDNFYFLFTLCRRQTGTKQHWIQDRKLLLIFFANRRWEYFSLCPSCAVFNRTFQNMYVDKTQCIDFVSFQFGLFICCFIIFSFLHLIVMSSD
jgi:hypothetical protein